MGASLVADENIHKPIASKAEIQDQLHSMSGFHSRYMVSNKVCRFWGNMVRQMDIAMLVPQHGRYLTGEAIPAFLDWIEIFSATSIYSPRNIIDFALCLAK